MHSTLYCMMVILFKKIKQGKAYWYLGENKWTNGKSMRLWQKYLGTAEKLKQILEEGFKPQKIDIMEFGLIAALLHIEKELNFVQIVDELIPKRNQGLSVGHHMLISIINRLDQPLSKNKLGEWFSDTILKRIFAVKSSYLSSQDFWNHWNYFNDEKIEDIQEKILEKLVSKISVDDLFYDPTNFITYIKEHEKNKIPRFGHSKEGIKGLRQVSLALLLTRKESIPLWHQTYEGNKNDTKEFKEFMQLLFKRIVYLNKKCKRITLIFDKGNNSKTNFKLLNERVGFFILGSLKPSEFQHMLQTPIEKFDKSYIDDKGEETKYYDCFENIYEGRKHIVVTYNKDLAYCQKLSTNKAINKAMQELNDLQSKLNKDKWAIRDNVLIKVYGITGKRYLKNLISYELSGADKNLSLNFNINEGEYEKKAHTFGKNILFTDNLDLVPEEIIKAYRNKDLIERQFKTLKNPHIISFTPMWCWTDKMIKVHAFSCVMALLFLALLTRKAGDGSLEITQQKLVEQLRKMKKVTYLIGKDKIIIQNTNFNQVQRKLYSLFELNNY